MVAVQYFSSVAGRRVDIFDPMKAPAALDIEVAFPEMAESASQGGENHRGQRCADGCVDRDAENQCQNGDDDSRPAGSDKTDQAAHRQHGQKYKHDVFRKVSVVFQVAAIRYSSVRVFSPSETGLPVAMHRTATKSPVCESGSSIKRVDGPINIPFAGLLARE